MCVLEDLTKIFCEVFDDNSIQINDNTTIEEIDGWDSLSDVNLLITIEERFNIKLDIYDLLHLKKVGAIKELIEDKLADKFDILSL